MPISVQAHHSFVDGLHMGQFADELQKISECRIIERSVSPRIISPDGGGTFPEFTIADG